MGRRADVRARRDAGGARRRALASFAAAVAAALACGCGGGSSTTVGGPDPAVGEPTWPAFYWVNSNSGPTFSWSIDGLAASAWIAAPMNGTSAGAGGTGCIGFGGNVAPGVAAQSMAQALPAGAPLRVWMQPKDLEFDGVAAPDLASAAAQRLAEFQACVEQDWHDAPVVSGFLCVREQRLGGDANCDTLATAFAQGVPPPAGGGVVAYGILGAPGDMNRTDVSAAMGEMYEPPYFAPSGTCAPSSDGTAYGGEIGAWIAAAKVVPASGSVAVPAFGGPSATCPLDYDQLAPAAAALSESGPPGLAGIAVWG